MSSLSPTLSPADELAEIRADIARLQSRETALETRLLRDPQGLPKGRWTKLELIETEQRQFNPDLLPEAIRQDPRYLENRLVQSLRCLPAQSGAPPRPGWPIRRDRAALH